MYTCHYLTTQLYICTKNSRLLLIIHVYLIEEFWALYISPTKQYFHILRNIYCPVSIKEKNIFNPTPVQFVYCVTYIQRSFSLPLKPLFSVLLAWNNSSHCQFWSKNCLPMLIRYWQWYQISLPVSTVKTVTILPAVTYVYVCFYCIISR